MKKRLHMTHQQLIDWLIKQAREVEGLEWIQETRKNDPEFDRRRLKESRAELKKLREEAIQRMAVGTPVRDPDGDYDRWVGDGHAECRFCGEVYPTNMSCMNSKCAENRKKRRAVGWASEHPMLDGM